MKSEYTCYDTFNAVTMTYYLIQFHFDGKIKPVTLNVNLLNLTCKLYENLQNYAYIFIQMIRIQICIQKIPELRKHSERVKTS